MCGRTPPPGPRDAPSARGARLEVLADGVHEVIEKCTSLHHLHVEAGARLGRSGSWLRPVRLRRPGRRVSRGPEARLGDGRRDAREVPDHQTRRDEASDISLASSEAILDAFAAAYG
jgi:hypothetical protein